MLTLLDTLHLHCFVKPPPAPTCPPPPHCLHSTSIPILDFAQHSLQTTLALLPPTTYTPQSTPHTNSVVSAAVWIPAGLTTITSVPIIGMGLNVTLTAATSSISSFLVFWLVLHRSKMRSYSCGPGCSYYLAPLFLATTVVGTCVLIFSDRVTALGKRCCGGWATGGAAALDAKGGDIKQRHGGDSSQSYHAVHLAEGGGKGPGGAGGSRGAGDQDSTGRGHSLTQFAAGSSGDGGRGGEERGVVNVNVNVNVNVDANVDVDVDPLLLRPDSDRERSPLMGTHDTSSKHHHALIDSNDNRGDPTKNMLDGGGGGGDVNAVSQGQGDTMAERARVLGRYVLGCFLSGLGGLFASCQVAAVTLGKSLEESWANCSSFSGATPANASSGGGHNITMASTTTTADAAADTVATAATAAAATVPLPLPPCSAALEEQFDKFGSWFVSFGIGAMGVTLFVLACVVSWDMVVRRKPPPHFHWKVLRVNGVAAGSFWVLGNFFLTLAVVRGGNAIVMAQGLSAMIVVSGLWGLLWYSEGGGGWGRRIVWLCGAVLTLVSMVLLGNEKIDV